MIEKLEMYGEFCADPDGYHEYFMNCSIKNMECEISYDKKIDLHNKDYTDDTFRALLDNFALECIENFNSNDSKKSIMVHIAEDGITLNWNSNQYKLPLRDLRDYGQNCQTCWVSFADLSKCVNDIKNERARYGDIYK